MRVVLDTNILISACWKPDGLEAQTVNLALSGAIVPCVSLEILAEYRDVLFRKKFAALIAPASELLALLEPRALQLRPNQPVHAASDEDDNRFLECAAAAGADFLVTGNLKHYPATWGVTKIVNARQFLSAVEPW